MSHTLVVVIAIVRSGLVAMERQQKVKGAMEEKKKEISRGTLI